MLFFRKTRNNEQRDELFVIFNSVEFVANEYMNIYMYAIFTFTQINKIRHFGTLGFTLYNVKNWIR